MRNWKPNVTVAAVVEHEGRLLMVREQTREGERLNQPAGHLDRGESLLDAVVRETLEETAYLVRPTALLGIHMNRYQHLADKTDVTYLRFSFVCSVVNHELGRKLDTGILEALWLTGAQIRARTEEHRSPLVLRCLEDFERGVRFPLDAIFTDPSCEYPS
jgi:8-oxo-dGTP pyrophosphatase MutT (NUDIX family)